MAESPPCPATFFAFTEMFPTEASCIDYIARWRWPEGFECPGCGSSVATRLRTRPLWECRGCGRQTSVTAGTALEHTKVPLRVWVYALWLVGRRKKGTSAKQFQRETGIGSYRTALYLLHKVREVLGEVDAYPLAGVVELDDTILPGKGMGPGKRLGKGGAFILAGVERRVFQDKRGRPLPGSGSARAYVAPTVDQDAVGGFAEACVQEDARIVSDGGGPYLQLAEWGFHHDVHEQHATPAVSERHLRCVHRLFSNLKIWLNGTFHGVSLKHLPRYIDEFIYRFNRRFHDPRIFGFLVRRLVRAPWTGIEAFTAEAST